MELKKAKNQHQKLQRINSILSAAENLFVEKGFQLPTAIEIAKKSDLAKGTLYLYFESKEHIFLSLLENYLQRFIESLELELNRYDNIQWQDVIEFSVNYWQNQPTLGQLYRLLDALLLNKVATKVVTQYQNRLGNELKRLAPHLKSLNPEQEAHDWLQLTHLTLDLLALAWLKSHMFNASQPQTPDDFKQLALHLLTPHWQQAITKSKQHNKPKTVWQKLIGS